MWHPPPSLSELVSSGYMQRIPTDPFTGRNDTWRSEKSGDRFELHSGAEAVRGAEHTIDRGSETVELLNPIAGVIECYRDITTATTYRL